MLKFPLKRYKTPAAIITHDRETPIGMIIVAKYVKALKTKCPLRHIQILTRSSLYEFVLYSHLSTVPIKVIGA